MPICLNNGRTETPLMVSWNANVERLPCSGVPKRTVASPLRYYMPPESRERSQHASAIELSAELHHSTSTVTTLACTVDASAP